MVQTNNLGQRKTAVKHFICGKSPDKMFTWQKKDPVCVVIVKMKGGLHACMCVRVQMCVKWTVHHCAAGSEHHTSGNGGWVDCGREEVKVWTPSVNLR